MSVRRSRLNSFFRSPRRHLRPRRQSQLGLHIEPLEQRALLAVTFNPLPGVPDGDPNSLRAAVEAANTSVDPDRTIQLAAGTYELTLSGSEGSTVLNNALGDLDVLRDVTIIGAGANATVINASGLGAGRVLHIDGGVTAEIEGVKITGGSASGGGGIQNEGNLTVRDSIVTNNVANDFGGGINSAVGSQLTVINTELNLNEATFGGAIYSNADVAGGIGFHLIDSALTGNSVDGRGGAIGVGQSSTSEISGSTITDNYALLSGGGIFSAGHSSVNWQAITIVDSTISGNDTDVDGGGIHVSARHEVRIYDSTLSGNTAGGAGGILNEGILVLDGSTLSSNTVTDLTYGSDRGGAMETRAGSTTTVTNSTLSGNTAPAGGGIYVSGGAVSLASTTITQNTATADGGGIGAVAGSLDFVNTILAENTAPTGPDGASGGSATVVSGGHNLIGIKDGLTYTAGTGDIAGTALAPEDPNLGTLQDNGGPTLTHALISGSPAIDAGDNAAAAGLTYDQRGSGYPRIIDAENNGSVIVDIGAYEFENTPPVGVDDGGPGFITDEETAFITASVIANDTDVDPGDTLSIDSFDLTGTVGLVFQRDSERFDYGPNDNFEYLPVGYSATDTFTYTVSDGNGGTDTATVTITINGVNDDPVAENDSGAGFITDEDSAFTTGNVLPNDWDPDDIYTLSVTGINTIGTLGTVINNGDGTFDYDPNGQFNHLAVGQTEYDYFAYQIEDDQGGIDSGTVIIEIQGTNDGPTANDDSGTGFTTDEETAFTTVSVVTNDTDPDTLDTLSIDSFDLTGTVGLVFQRDSERFDYGPNDNFEYLSVGYSATDTFTYTVSDGHGGTDTATVTITINGVNDDPIAGDDEGAGFITDEETAFTTGNVLPNDWDPDDGYSLTVTGINTIGTIGLVEDNGDGTFNYDPNGQFNHLAVGEKDYDYFAYQISDGLGGTDSGTVIIEIQGVNDGPTAMDDGSPGFVTDEDTPFTTGSVLANDYDPDVSDTLSVFSLDTTGTVGSVTDNGNGTFNYDPNGQFDSLAAGASTVDTFSYMVSDGHGGTDTAIVTIDIVGVNDGPTANDNAFDVDEGSPTGTIVGSVTATDPDVGDSLAFSIVGGNTDNAFAIDGVSGQITVDNAAALDFDTNPTFVLTVQVEDTGGLTDTATVTISLNDVGGGPDPGVTLEDGVLTIVGTSGDDDVIVIKFGTKVYVLTDFAGRAHFPADDVESIVIQLLDGDDEATTWLLHQPILIDGGTGNDLLEGSLGDDVLLGGPGNDRLIGSWGADILIGGEGDDILRGGQGKDILIGGLDADTLSGGSGGDILIGGYTTLDNDLDALDAILTEWNSGASYATRVDRIRTGTGPNLDGEKFEAGETVLDDGASDTLRGNGGRDWFFAELGDDPEDDDETTDARLSEIIDML